MRRGVSKANTALATTVVAIVLAAVAAYSYESGTHTAAETTTIGTETFTIYSLGNYHSGTRVFTVTFQQVPDCGNNLALPWAVSLGGLTESQPAGATLPFEGVSGGGDANTSRIVFAVPDGQYPWTAEPNDLVPTSGTVLVNGSSVLVQLQWAITCPQAPAGY